MANQLFNPIGPPKDGYILKNWSQLGYRSTAVAYLQREGLFSVENQNGRWYTLTELKDSLIGSK